MCLFENYVFLIPQQIRSSFFGVRQGLLVLPFFYFCLMTAQQYLRHFPTFVLCRTGLYARF